jgi:hypothetical protein
MRALILLLLFGAVAHAGPTDGRAIVFVVDRAMSAKKIELARKAVTTVTLHDDDEIGVVAYGAKATVILPLGHRGKSGSVRSTLEPTKLTAGLEAAHAMLRKSKRARLVIVLTDVDSTDGIEPILAKLRTDNITISAVGVDSTNGRTLAAIATAGKGRRYQAHDSAEMAAAIQKELDRPRPGEETFALALLIDRCAAKIEMAKEAARSRVEALSPNDMLTVIAFDASPTFHVRPQRAANKIRISHDISRLMRAGGHCDSKLALQTAFETLKTMGGTDPGVVLFGRPPSDDTAEIVKAMAAADIPLEIVNF